MKNVLRKHYLGEGVLKNIAEAEHFHLGGIAATKRLAGMCKLVPGMRVLDVGSGIGGPAKYLSKTFQCNVLGIDIIPEFVEYSKAHCDDVLCDWLKQGDDETRGKIWFENKSLSQVSTTGNYFDLVWMQHILLHFNEHETEDAISNIQKILKRGGQLAVHDIFRPHVNSKRPLLPVAFASDYSQFTLKTPNDLVKTIEKYGFMMKHGLDDTEASIEWLLQSHSREFKQATRNLLGVDAKVKSENMLFNLKNERLSVHEFIFEKK